MSSPNDVEYEVDPDKSKEEPLSKDEKIKELEKEAKTMKNLAVAMVVIAILAFGTVVGLLINLSIERDTPDNLDGPLYCNRPPMEFKGPRDRLGDPVNPGVFHGLTVTEIMRVREYFEREWNLTKPNTNTTLMDARIWSVDLELPPKREVLEYLDNGGPQPDRYARVTMLRGDLDDPVVEELICGPLHNISECAVNMTVPFSVRPMQSREYTYEEHHLIKEMQRMFGHIFSECFNASFDLGSCGDNCLNWWEVPVGSNLMNEATYVRRIWFYPLFDIKYFLLYPLPMAFLCNIDDVNEYNWTIEKVWFHDTLYDSPEMFLAEFNAGNITKVKVPYPRGEDTKFSTMKPRGTEEERNRRRQRPPQLIEPDGKRYTVQYDKVEYMGLWSFHYRISPVYGPGIYDVRYRGERIAYEISTQEIIVQYTGAAPMPSQCSYVDTCYGLGYKSKNMVAGADCPATATHLQFVTNSHDKDKPAVFPQAACVFEQNTGQPLMRHHSYSKGAGAFYGGILDSALIVRSSQTVDNYDYVMDFTFHQNGALGVQILNTGYVMTTFYYQAEKDYGAEVARNAFAPMHLHSVSFKVDIDINGVSNRYETLNIEEQTVDVLQSPGIQLSKTKLVHSLKRTENAAAYIYNFQKPKYLIFYHNESDLNPFGQKRAYRLINKGVSAQITKPGEGNELAWTWARYQMAVTKRKEDEPRSSSPYNQWETTKPYVEFSKFIDGESILDEDLVAWVSLSNQHIPHSEDIPITPTAGEAKSFYLVPYNYFTEDPSMDSPDLVYIAMANPTVPEEGVVVDVKGSGDVTDQANFGTCEFKPENITSQYIRDPNAIFEATESKGID